MLCPNCGCELDDGNYCSNCGEFFDQDDYDFDSMIDNGDEICLNCTYWSVSPYGASHGMVCRKGQLSDGPGDSCGLFVKSVNFANYGDNGEFQFNETRRNTSNKLYHWKNNH